LTPVVCGLPCVSSVLIVVVLFVLFYPLEIGDVHGSDL
jgi:hypothetical protein